MLSVFTDSVCSTGPYESQRVLAEIGPPAEIVGNAKAGVAARLVGGCPAETRTGKRPVGESGAGQLHESAAVQGQLEPTAVQPSVLSKPRGSRHGKT